MLRPYLFCHYRREHAYHSSQCTSPGTKIHPVNALFLRYLPDKQILVLSSLNTITKESAIVTMILGRTSPDPGFGPQVELSGRHTGGLLNLLGVGKTLPSKRITAEEAPPALLQVEPSLLRWE